MAKAMRRSEEIEKEKKLIDDTALIRAAIKEGITTRESLAQYTGLKKYRVIDLLMSDKELKSEFIIRRRILADTAADNIADIVNDRDHPHNYAASKFIVQTYKSELDEFLESQDQQEIAVDVAGADIKDRTVTIRFSKKAD